MLETAEVYKLKSANDTIDTELKKGKISQADADIMKAYYKDYINAE